jgi:hypothetical protein
MSARCHRLCAWHFAAALRSVAVRARLARELAHDIDAALGRIGTPTPADSAAVIAELAAIG